MQSSESVCNNKFLTAHPPVFEILLRHFQVESSFDSRRIRDHLLLPKMIKL
jgi:hypothetical protein